MEKTYTGRTMGGAKASIVCPPWCTVDHAFWDEAVDDTFHVGDTIELLPPGMPAPMYSGVRVPPLLAELSVHSTGKRPCDALILLSWGETKDRGVDLDVPGVDAMLDQLDSFRTKLAAMRQTLATIHTERKEASAA